VIRIFHSCKILKWRKHSLKKYSSYFACELWLLSRLPKSWKPRWVLEVDWSVIKKMQAKDTLGLAIEKDSELKDSMSCKWWCISNMLQTWFYHLQIKNGCQSWISCSFCQWPNTQFCNRYWPLGEFDLTLSMPNTWSNLLQHTIEDFCLNWIENSQNNSYLYFHHLIVIASECVASQSPSCVFVSM